MANPATESSHLYEGLILGGKYRLEAEIGRGAMGTVWAAMHETLGQRVAVKIISQEHAHSEELRRRFDTEARAAAKLRSRFVVGVYDNGITDGGLPYIVMEYLEGECLEDRIAREGCLHVSDVARISRHIARALSKAHARGIVHRDLKPANIFITKSDDEDDGDDWTAKVLDFGIAKMEDFGDRSTTKTGTVLGTPLFMSPEQVRGSSDVDARADLYSMGMVVYNMLTGTYAFEGQSFGDLLVSICTDPLPELSRSAPTAPPSLNAWFKKACARDPKERYQTADELMKALSDAIGDTSPSTRLSVSDITTTERLIPLAETHIASSGVPSSGVKSSGVKSSGARETDAGAIAHTVVSSPDKKSRTPLILGGLALVLGALLTIHFFRGEKRTETGAAPASSPLRADEPAQKTIEKGSGEPEAIGAKTDFLKTDAKREAPGADRSAQEGEALAAPATTKVGTPSGAVASKTNPAPQKAPPKTNPKPATSAATSPAPAPKPQAKPADLDLGF